MADSSTVRVIVEFIDSEGANVLTIRLPLADPNMTVRQCAGEALVRFAKSHTNIDRDVAIRDVTVGGVSLFYNDKVTDAIDVQSERLQMRLGGTVDATKRNLYTLGNGSKPAAAAPAAAVASSSAPIKAEPSMDLTAGNLAAAARNSKNDQPAKSTTFLTPLLPNNKTSVGAKTLQQQFAESESKTVLNELAAKKESKNSNATGTSRSSRNISDIACPSTQQDSGRSKPAVNAKPAAAVKQEKQTAANKKPAAQPAKKGAVPTPENAKVIDTANMSTSERRTHFEKKGEGWNSENSKLFPSNYVDDPDQLMREARKRKREEKTAPVVTVADTKSKTAAAKVAGRTAGAKVDAQRPSANAAEVLPNKMMRPEFDAPNVIRSLFDVDAEPVYHGGAFSLGMTVEARANKGSWALATIEEVDEFVITVKWLNGTRTDVIPVKDVRRPAGTSTNVSTKAASPPNDLSSLPIPNADGYYIGMNVESRQFGGPWYAATLVGMDDATYTVEWKGNNGTSVVVKKDIRIPKAKSARPTPLASAVQSTTVTPRKAANNVAAASKPATAKPAAAAKPAATAKKAAPLPVVTPPSAELTCKEIRPGVAVEVRENLKANWYAARILSVTSNNVPITVMYENNECGIVLNRANIRKPTVAAVASSSEDNNTQKSRPAGWGRDAEKYFDPTTWCDPHHPEDQLDEQAMSQPRPRRTTAGVASVFNME